MLFTLSSSQILCMHGGLSPELKSLEQIKRVARPTDVPDSGLLCDLLWADPDKDIQVRSWGSSRQFRMFGASPHMSCRSGAAAAAWIGGGVGRQQLMWQL